jgi:hypothetical protein
MPATTIEQATVAAVRELPPEQQQEVLDFAGFLGTKKKRPLKSMRGLWKDLNISLSEEDIAEARKEMWGNFPREHFSSECGRSGHSYSPLVPCGRPAAVGSRFGRARQSHGRRRADQYTDHLRG